MPIATGIRPNTTERNASKMTFNATMDIARTRSLRSAVGSVIIQFPIPLVQVGSIGIPFNKLPCNRSCLSIITL